MRFLTSMTGNVGLAAQLAQGTHTVFTTPPRPTIQTITTPFRHVSQPTALPSITTIKSTPVSVKTKANATTKVNRSPAVSKEKDRKAFSGSSTLRDDDDINDVAAMGGVNLVEESQRILATNAEFVGAQIRSCKDENFLFTNQLQTRINQIGNIVV